MRRLDLGFHWGSVLSLFLLCCAGVGMLGFEPLYTKRARAQSLPPLSESSIELRNYLTHPFSFASSREAIYLIYRLLSLISSISSSSVLFLGLLID